MSSEGRAKEPAVGLGVEEWENRIGESRASLRVSTWKDMFTEPGRMERIEVAKVDVRSLGWGAFDLRCQVGSWIGWRVRGLASGKYWGVVGIWVAF